MKRNAARLLIVGMLILHLFSCAQPAPYTIGFLGGLTGGLRDLSIAGRNGVILAIEEVNRKGGIGERQVVLLVQDDKGDPETVVQSIKQFADKSIAGIIGPMSGELSRIAASQADQERVVMISPTANSADFTEQGDFFFRISPADRDEAYHLADLAYNKRGYRRISILYDLSNREYAENRVRYFSDFVEEYGGVIVQVTSYTTRDDTDFGLLATQLSQNNPDAVFIIGAAFDLARTCRALHIQEHDLPVLTTGWAISSELIKHGGGAVEGVEFFQPYDVNSSRVYRNFLREYDRRFHAGPPFGAFYAYEAANIVLKALEQTGKKRNLNSTIHEIMLADGLKDAIEFNSDGVAERPLVHRRIENGRIVEVSTQ